MGTIEVKKIATGITIFAAILLFMGCSSKFIARMTKPDTPFYLAYETEEIIRDPSKVATLITERGLAIDEVDVNPKNMRCANARSGTKYLSVVADVIPGTYKLAPRYGAADTQNAYLQYASKSFTLEAGRVYSVGEIFTVPVIKDVTTDDLVRKIAGNRNNAVFEKNK
jgi:hypothetical protein